MYTWYFYQANPTAYRNMVTVLDTMQLTLNILKEKSFVFSLVSSFCFQVLEKNLLFSIYNVTMCTHEGNFLLQIPYKMYFMFRLCKNNNC